MCFCSLFWRLVALDMFLVPGWQSQGCSPKVTVLAQNHLLTPLFAWLFCSTLWAKPQHSGTPGSYGDVVVTSVPCGAVWPFWWAPLGSALSPLSKKWPGSCTPPKPYLPLHWNEKSLSWAGGKGNQSCPSHFFWVCQNLVKPSALICSQHLCFSLASLSGR